MMTWHLLLISFGVDFANSTVSGKPIETVSTKYAIDRCVTDPYFVVTLQVPHDTDWAKVISTTQMQYLLDDLRGNGCRMSLCYWRLLYQPVFAVFIILNFPALKAGPGQAKIPAGLANIFALLCMP